MSSNNRPYRSIAGNATAKLVATGYVNLTGIDVSSKNNEDNWIHVYDAAAAADVTVGTTTPKQSWPVATSDDTHYVMTDIYLDDGLKFDLGLVFAVTKEADAGATAPDSNCLVNMRIN